MLRNTLNYEVKKTYQVGVRVSDDTSVNGDAALSFEKFLTVNINDVAEAPIAASGTYYVVEESEVGTLVGMVQAASAESVEEELRFAITGGNTGSKFRIHSCTGQIFVAASGLSRAGTAIYTLTITVTAAATTTIMATIHVTGRASRPNLQDQTVSVSSRRYEIVCGTVGLMKMFL